MNRRTLLAAGISTLLLPSTAFAQVATPEYQEPPADLTARKLTDTMQSISPLALVEALEVAEITNEHLIAAADGTAPIAVPWTDWSDTDLYNSYGGVALSISGTDLNSPDTGMVGAYIVYESAEIAYLELQRKLEDLWDGSQTSNVGGTNAWIVSSDELQLAVYRIGYVIGIALETGAGQTTLGTIQHLASVAEGLAG